MRPLLGCGPAARVRDAPIRRRTERHRYIVRVRVRCGRTIYVRDRAWPLLLLFFLWTREVLLVGDLLQPIDILAVELLCNCDVRHARGWRRAMPVLLAGRTPNHVARPNFLDGFAPALGPSESRCDDQGLAERVRVPRRARTRFERYAPAGDTGGLGRLNDG